MKCPHCGKKIVARSKAANGAKGGRPPKTFPSVFLITDGFGQAWSSKCPKCKRNTMEVVRPGKVQCSNCCHEDGVRRTIKLDECDRARVL